MLLFCLFVCKLLAQKPRFYAKTTPFVPRPLFFVLCPLSFVLVFVLCPCLCSLRQISKAFPLFVANKGGCRNEKRRKTK